jgi:hypothetical protein
MALLWNTLCWGILPRSLHLFPESTLPNCEVHFAISPVWQFCQVDSMDLPIPHYYYANLAILIFERALPHKLQRANQGQFTGWSGLGLCRLIIYISNDWNIYIYIYYNIHDICQSLILKLCVQKLLQLLSKALERASKPESNHSLWKAAGLTIITQATLTLGFRVTFRVWSNWKIIC